MGGDFSSVVVSRAVAFGDEILAAHDAIAFDEGVVSMGAGAGAGAAGAGEAAVAAAGPKSPARIG